MSGTRPGRLYRKLESGAVEVNRSGPLQAHPANGTLLRMTARVLGRFARWRARRMSPEQMQRARREQEILATTLPHPSKAE
jgi:hypothetical protein